MKQNMFYGIQLSHIFAILGIAFVKLSIAVVKLGIAVVIPSIAIVNLEQRTIFIIKNENLDFRMKTQVYVMETLNIVRYSKFTIAILGITTAIPSLTTAILSLTNAIPSIAKICDKCIPYSMSFLIISKDDIVKISTLLLRQPIKQTLHQSPRVNKRTRLHSQKKLRSQKLNSTISTKILAQFIANQT